jgi:hypothetical protein
MGPSSGTTSTVPFLAGDSNPIKDVLLFPDGGEEDALIRRMDAIDRAFVNTDVAPPSRGLPERVLAGDDMGWICPMEGLCEGCVDLDSSGAGVAGNANGGVVEKKSALTGGDWVDVEYG